MQTFLFHGRPVIAEFRQKLPNCYQALITYVLITQLRKFVDFKQKTTFLW